MEVRKRPFLLHLFSAKSLAPPFRFGCCYMAPKRLTSWVFHGDTAGAPLASHTCCVSPELQSFTALCGGVDSTGWAAAAAAAGGGDEGPVGGDVMCGTP